MEKDELFAGNFAVPPETWMGDLGETIREKEKEPDQKTADLIRKPFYTEEDLPESERSDFDDFFEALEDDESGEEESEYAKEESMPLTWNICEELEYSGDEFLNDLVTRARGYGAFFMRVHASPDERWDHFFNDIRKLDQPATFALYIDSDLTEEDIVRIWRERVGFIGVRDILISSLEFDPIGYFVRSGNIVHEEKSFKNLAEIFRRITTHLHDCRILQVDMSPFAHAGAVRQLAGALSMTAEYFDRLSKREVPLEELMHLLSFRFAGGSDFFLEIAKYRAMKTLWQNLVRSFIEFPEFISDPYVHAVIPHGVTENEAAEDALYRDTTMAMSAILGGCAAVSVMPVKETTAEVSAGIQRQAVLMQEILRFEGRLDMYRDAATGSYYIESLSMQLAEKAWTLFRTWEKQGGFLACWKNNPAFITAP